MAPEVGLEPTTSRLTAARSTIELLWNSEDAQFTGAIPHRQTDSPVGGGTAARTRVEPRMDANER